MLNNVQQEGCFDDAYLAMACVAQEHSCHDTRSTNLGVCVSSAADDAGGACDAIEFLLTPDSEQGCSLDVTDNEGNTAWHVSAEGGHIKAVQCLLKEGAQLESTNDAGCTALHIAARSGQPALESFDLFKALCKALLSPEPAPTLGTRQSFHMHAFPASCQALRSLETAHTCIASNCCMDAYSVRWC